MVVIQVSETDRWDREEIKVKCISSIIKPDYVNGHIIDLKEI